MQELQEFILTILTVTKKPSLIILSLGGVIMLFGLTSELYRKHWSVQFQVVRTSILYAVTLVLMGIGYVMAFKSFNGSLESLSPDLQMFLVIYLVIGTPFLGQYVLEINESYTKRKIMNEMEQLRRKEKRL